jgi:chaperone BCS1
MWSNVKNKTRRPLSSIILLDGVINSLVKDVKEFMATEDWYVEAGIPYRRGYLLHGPPGAGKSASGFNLLNISWADNFSASTIYALVSIVVSRDEKQLKLNYNRQVNSDSKFIPCLSRLACTHLFSSFKTDTDNPLPNSVDDSFLQKAASSIPKHSIFLIEDIDCAFPSREEMDDADTGHYPGSTMYPGRHTVHPGTIGAFGQKRSLVTLSGLLNVLDGVGSEEGKLFFATVRVSFPIFHIYIANR